MNIQFGYGTNFDEEWGQAKEKIKEKITELDCIDSKGEIIWPFYLCVNKREKKNRQH